MEALLLAPYLCPAENATRTEHGHPACTRCRRQAVARWWRALTRRQVASRLGLGYADGRRVRGRVERRAGAARLRLRRL